MVTLSCGVFSCANNEGGLCGAESIQILGGNAKSKDGTQCANYMESTFINEAKTIVNTNYLGEIMQVLSGYEEPKIHPKVNCDVCYCFYNGNGKCEARSIMISDNINLSNSKAICNTYEEEK